MFSIFVTSTTLKTFKLVITYTRNVRESWLNNENFKEKERKRFLIFIMSMLAWNLYQYNRCFVLLLDLPTCLGFMVQKSDMNIKKRLIIWKMNLSRNNPIISWMRVKNCLKKKLDIQNSLPEVFLKNTVRVSFLTDLQLC